MSRSRSRNFCTNNRPSSAFVSFRGFDTTREGNGSFSQASAFSQVLGFFVKACSRFGSSRYRSAPARIMSRVVLVSAFSKLRFARGLSSFFGYMAQNCANPCSISMFFCLVCSSIGIVFFGGLVALAGSALSGSAFQGFWVTPSGSRVK